MQRLKKWYLGASIRVRITLLFVIMSIIPVFIMGWVSLNQFSKNLEESGIRDSQKYLEFLDYRLEQQMDSDHKNVLLTAYKSSVRDYFDPEIVLTADERELTLRYASRELIGLRLRENAQSVMLISDDGSALAYSLADFGVVLRVERVDYQPLSANDFRIYDAWADPYTLNGVPVVPYERVVISTDGTRNVARLVVNYPESSFTSLYGSYESEKNSKLYLINERGKIFGCTDKAFFAADADEALGLSADALVGSSGRLHLGNTLVTYRRDTARGYLLAEFIPLSVFSRMFRPILLLMTGIAGICILACIALGALLSRSVTRPLNALINRISSDTDSAAHAGARASQNEIAILSARYDDVVRRLETLIADYYEEQRKKKEAQIRALEFQINPHFLYNTLSTIIWLIDAGEDERAIQITQELSGFFRISISKGRDFITLREEVRHVKLYIDIQMARYEGKIFIDFDVPDALMDFETPKLILQPLVENSIIHAMQTNHDKRCHIRIGAQLVGDDIWLMVEDDGETATVETIEAMNRFLVDRESAGQNYGIGISNVHDRIRMCFGESYGLHYERRNDHTCAILRIKARRKGESSNVSHADRG